MSTEDRDNSAIQLSSLSNSVNLVAISLAIFTFLDAVLIRPLPYYHPSRLAFVTESVPLLPRANLSYPDYLDWKASAKSFQSLAGYGGDAWTITRLAP